MLKVSSGLGKLTLLRSVHFGIFFVVLIECGASLSYPYRLILSFIFFLLFFNRYLFLFLNLLSLSVQGYDHSCLEWWFTEWYI